MSNQIAVFEQKKIRHIEHEGEMFFSVVDVIEALTDSPNPRRYWSDLKKREAQLYSICVQLKIAATDGKFYKPKRQLPKVAMRQGMHCVLLSRIPTDK